MNLAQSTAAIVAAVDDTSRPGWAIVRKGPGWERELRVPRHHLVAPEPSPAVESRATSQDRIQNAQPSPASSPEPDAGPPRSDEWQVGAGHAWSIDLLRSEGGRRFVPVTVSWGRDVMRDVGPGWLRGRLMWAVEAMPLYWQDEPTTTVGVGVSPLVWRWRFVPRARAAAFAELAFGGLFTADAVPEGTEAANFLTHGAFGIRWRPGRTASWVTAYRFQHISNGNQLATNPGVNAHVIWVGLSFIR